MGDAIPLARRRGAESTEDSFEIFCNDVGRWLALRADGMVLGTFFKRADAVRFARHECANVASLMLICDAEARAQAPARRVA